MGATRGLSSSWAVVVGGLGQGEGWPHLKMQDLGGRKDWVGSGMGHRQQYL